MSESDKNKAGLQKKVSSVFKGVPVPQNNSTRQAPGAPAPQQTPDAAPKPAPADNQTSKSSLISRLSRDEGSPNKAAQSQTANTFKKPAPATQTPQSPVANNLPQPKESLKQTAPQHEEVPLIIEANDGLLQQIKDKLFTPKPGVSPTKQKAMVIMIPILAIIMIFAFRQVLSKSPRKTKGTEADVIPVVSNTNSGNEIDWEIPEPIKIITKDPVQLPDGNSTKSAVETTDPNSGVDMQEQGVIMIRDILYSKDKPSAVIGARIVYVGDKINGATVIKIDRDSVEFEKDGEKWEQNVRDGKKIPLSDNAGQTEGPSETIK